MLRSAARPLSRGASLVAQYDQKVAAGALIRDSTQREALRRLERLRQELLAHGTAMVEYQQAVCHTGLEPPGRPATERSASHALGPLFGQVTAWRGNVAVITAMLNVDVDGWANGRTHGQTD